jgi:peptide/nickel transport system substrate-binding protein
MQRVWTAIAGIVITALASNALAQGTLRIGMTAADIPLTTGQTDNGSEGMRFMGYTVYDGLVNWDLSSADKASDIVPGLATSWSVDAADKTRWTFKIRPGVTLHDGSAFKAQSVVWNLEKLLNDKSPQYDPRQLAQGRSRTPTGVTTATPKWINCSPGSATPSIRRSRPSCCRRCTRNTSTTHCS